MTGTQFERWLCRVFKLQGWWALNISKDARGAQPFDIIAIKYDLFFAIDCKVCGSNKFQLRRIEDNQWLSFQTVAERTSGIVGIMIWYDGQVYFYSYYELDAVNNNGVKLIEIDEEHLWMSRDKVDENNRELQKEFS